jgi:hypothetical protein
MDERFAAQWQEIRRHATIEYDSAKLNRLRAELEKRKQQGLGPLTLEHMKISEQQR